MKLTEIVDLRIEAGSFPAMTREEYIRWRNDVAVSNEAKDSIVGLQDGRTIKIRHRPMPGGGWVATHEDITEQRQSEIKIEYMAHHDSLTDLPNRVLLNDRLEYVLERVQRGEMVAVHHLDLDQFKAVNDTFGHPCGDKLLRIVAERLRGLVGETDTIARMGGDEFVIVQATIADPAEATSLAQGVIDTLSKPYDIDGQQAVIGVSIGISVGPGDGSNPDKLLRNADLALYRAKSDGRGTFRFFEPVMDLQMQTRRIMEQDLRKALPAGEFELHYQPVVNLASKEISGFEALIRWNHPSKGMISPADFIPLAEEIGFIVPLGEWVIRQACATAAQWPDDLHVAVNISAIQFRNPGLMQVIVSALAASGLAPTRLEIEITETVLLHNKEATLAVLHQLRALGIRIAMDDFGTGYSSLTYLQSFPFDKIKIDRSFVKNITENSSSLNIVRAVAALANGMGMTATAEGVETAEQLHSIASEGCTEMQGFLFSRPLPAAEIERQFLSGRGPREFRPYRRGLIPQYSGAREARPKSRAPRSHPRCAPDDDATQNSAAIFDSISSSATRLAGPSNSLSRASCLLATSFLARASTALPLSVRTRMCERRSLVERIRAHRSRLSSASSIDTKFGRRMPSVLAISVWLRPGLRSSSSSTENCAGVSCSGATQRRKSSNTLSCARLSE